MVVEEMEHCCLKQTNQLSLVAEALDQVRGGAGGGKGLTEITEVFLQLSHFDLGMGWWSTLDSFSSLFCTAPYVLIRHMVPGFMGAVEGSFSTLRQLTKTSIDFQFLGMFEENYPETLKRLFIIKGGCNPMQDVPWGVFLSVCRHICICILMQNIDMHLRATQHL